MEYHNLQWQVKLVEDGHTVYTTQTGSPNYLKTLNLGVLVAPTDKTGKSSDLKFFIYVEDVQRHKMGQIGAWAAAQWDD